MRVLIHGIGRSGTTVVQRVINSCNDVWITNEFLLYDMPFGYVLHSGRGINTPARYFKSLLLKDGWNTKEEHRVEKPPTLKKSFITRCLARLDELGEDTPKNRICVVEELLYKNMYTVFGDKVLEPETLKHLIDIGLDYKLIHVTRHCSQTVASRQFYRFDGIKTQEDWAVSCKKVLELKPLLNENYLQIRLEDFLSQHEKVLSSISSFLSVPLKELERGYELKVNLNKHRNYLFESFVPTEMVASILKELGY